jgi:hypothetical protein
MICLHAVVDDVDLWIELMRVTSSAKLQHLGMRCHCLRQAMSTLPPVQLPICTRVGELVERQHPCVLWLLPICAACSHSLLQGHADVSTLELLPADVPPLSGGCSHAGYSVKAPLTGCCAGGPGGGAVLSPANKPGPWLSPKLPDPMEPAPACGPGNTHTRHTNMVVS